MGPLYYMKNKIEFLIVSSEECETIVKTSNQQQETHTDSYMSSSLHLNVGSVLYLTLYYLSALSQVSFTYSKS